MTVANGYAVDDPGAPALWPWLRLMRGWEDVQLPEIDAGEPDATARFRLFLTVADVLRSRAAGAGLLIVLEDMHWADRTSVLLLRHMVGEVGSEPLAIVVTCRDGVPGPLVDLVPDLVRGETARAIALGGLAVADIADWLPILTGGADDALAIALHERTGGNPLLVRLSPRTSPRVGRARRRWAS
jgi:predicted ATPase